MPLWFSSMIEGDDVFVYGDGETSYDFCYIDNCIQNNFQACLATDEKALKQVYKGALPVC